MERQDSGPDPYLAAMAPPLDRDAYVLPTKYQLCPTGGLAPDAIITLPHAHLRSLERIRHSVRETLPAAGSLPTRSRKTT